MSDAEAWIAGLSREAEAFRCKNPLPHAWYNRDGDALEVYLDRGPGIYEAVNKFVTVVVSRCDRTKMIGFVLKNISTSFRDSIEQIQVLRAPSMVQFLLFEAGKLNILSLDRRPEAPPGEPAHGMSIEDLLSGMQAVPAVPVVNIEDIQAALVRE